MEFLKFLKSDTFRRAVAFSVGMAAPYLNQKFGLNVPTEQVVAGTIFAAGYIAQSVVNDMHARSAGVAAAKAVTSTSDAIAVMVQAEVKP